MKQFQLRHERRDSIGGLVKFRFSVRVSGPIPNLGWLMEIWTNQHYLLILRKEGEEMNTDDQLIAQWKRKILVQWREQGIYSDPAPSPHLDRAATLAAEVVVNDVQGVLDLAQHHTDSMDTQQRQASVDCWCDGTIHRRNHPETGRHR